MCTVSFVRSENKTIITSNRDEHVKRSSSAPQFYTINDKKVLFPKDVKSDGTWYAADQNQNVIVLLNGAAEKHKHLPPYRKSRGLIVLDLISAESPLKAWSSINLNDIEPFTLVLFQQSKLYETRWNGIAKESIQMDENKNHIWSSTTLYPEAIREKRKEWFTEYLASKPQISETEMFHFHRYTEDDNHSNGLVINRNNFLKTLSITQTVIEEHQWTMNYNDLSDGRQSTISVPVSKTKAS